MQMNFKLNKAGVSLIAVLLFMLIATIAATATWKWITSEGFSSTSRMLKREAYQSSIAGIENARAWMTYHPNDVGALIRQYLDGNRQPVNLDNQLRSLQRDGQEYNVWLTGVNVEGSSYKLKVYSAGKARGSAKHNEVAIFNVDGLYRVQIPQEQIAHKTDFDYNYFGGSTSNHGDVFARSMLINGDLLDGNPASIDSNLVVTGNFKVSGNSIAVHGTACVGGYLDADNGLVGNNFYVEGDLKNLKIRPLTAKKGSETINLGNKIYGSLFVNGNITAANGNQVIDGNLTLRGKWTTNMTGYDAGVKGDLCVETENGQIYFPSQNREFKAEGNVWMESDYPMWTGTDNFDKYKRIVLGKKGKDVYVKTGHPGSDYVALRAANTFVEQGGKYFGWAADEPTRNSFQWGRYAIGTAARQNETYSDVFKNRPGVDGGPVAGPIGPFGGPAGGGQKEGIHYLYNWPSSTDLVKLDAFNDTEWNKELLVYKLNDERFWNPSQPNSYKSINFTGNQITGSPYCRMPGNYNMFGMFGAPVGMKEKARPSCDVTPWFKVDGTFKTPFPGTKPSDLTCAQSVKAHCDSLWEEPPSGGCGTAKYLVPDALKTGISYFESYATKSPNATCSQLVNANKNNFNFSNFNSCYELAKTHDATAEPENKILYNDYLVIKVTNNNIFTSSQGTLSGKFIFIFENDLKEMMKLPATSAGSYVFMYFKDGLSGTILPMDNSEGLEFNYFIYTKNDISNALFNQTVLKGSIYAAVEDEASGEKVCAKVDELTFNKGMEYNQDLVSDLTNARIICNNDGGVCGGVNGVNIHEDEEEEENAIDGENGRDRYFISMASQLGVTIDSRYEAEEKPPQLSPADTLKKSYIVVPRIIYLPSDPYGKLEDYYNVLALNGSAVKKEDVVNLVNCSGGLPTTGSLFQGAALTQGIYKCTARPANEEELPFWVVVGRSQRGDGDISFQDPTQKLGAISTVPVNVLVSPHSSELTVTVNCPEVPNSAWSYLKNTSPYYKADLSSGTNCVFKFPVSSSDEVFTLFNVSTENATTGTLTFTLLPGDGFTLKSPYYTVLNVSSTVTINRADVNGINEIITYCENHSEAKCPCAASTCTAAEISAWPDCDYTGNWVEPQSAGMVVVTNEVNESWSVPVGGEGEIRLAPRSDKCVVVIPEGNDNKLDRATLAAEAGESGSQSYTLRASAKAKYRSVKIAFVGDITGTPRVDYVAGTRADACVYNSASPTGATDEIKHICTVSVFDNEQIQLSVNKNLAGNENFSYWQCSGISCPTTNTIGSAEYDSFALKDDATIVYVHFGEVDDHCFVDEFKGNNLTCNSENEELCVDTCASIGHTCESAENGDFVNAKWHLLDGSLGDVEVYAGHISIKNERNKTRGKNNKYPGVKVINTVDAGRTGILKALFRMPQATTSYGKNSDNIANSGFMLRSNDNGSEYMMLNMYVNTSGYLETQLCSYGICHTGELKKNGSPISVSTASMVMMTAVLTDTNLTISAFTGRNYYGAPDEYTYTYAFSTQSYNDMEHNRVGYMLADPNFKLYGIGWESFDYNSKCWNSFSVKCSFAAKSQNGVIEFGKDVVPWVGHSGWFDSKNCTPYYYYYNGNDVLCGNAGVDGIECSTYNFQPINSKGEGGMHGYGNDIKTAKAALKCTDATHEEEMWISSTLGEHSRAHCGIFWTGSFTACSAHIPKLLPTGNDPIVLQADEFKETLVIQGDRYNMRGSVLNVELDNPDHNEVEIVLVSKHDYNEEGYFWGDKNTEGIYLSRSVKMNGNRASFDVLTELAEGAEGFDPENIRSIILKNHGTTPVRVILVSASCKSVVDVINCKAVYEKDSAAWIVTANIGNMSHVGSIVTSMSGGSTMTKECSETGANCTKDEVAGVARFKLTDTPYEHPGAQYHFTVTATSTENVSYEKECSVEPETIPSVTRECKVNKSVVQQGEGYPQFQVSVNGCPSSGCGYDILFGTETLTYGSITDVAGAKTTKPGNTTTNQANVGSYSYTVRSTDDLFESCTATFSVVEKNNNTNPVATTCSIENSTSLQAGEQGRFTFAVAGNSQGTNIVNRNYRLVHGTSVLATGNTGSNASQTATFTVPAGGGNVNLEIWDGTEYKNSCTATLTVSDLSVDCGVSRNTWSATTGGTFYTSDNLYFMAKNNANIAGTVSVTVLDENDNSSTGTISNYSQWSSVKNLGTLSAGTHTYTIKYGDEEVCSDEITVVAEGADVTATCAFKNNDAVVTTASSGYPYLYFAMTNIRGSGEYASNKSFVLKQDGSEVATFTGDVGNAQSPGTAGISNFAAPTTGGDHVYTVEYGGNQICSTTLTVEQALTCATSSDNPVAGNNFDFTVSAGDGGNCWSCTMYNDDVSESNWALQNGVTSKKWTLASTGNAQRLRATCTCDQNLTECSKWINFTSAAPNVTCPTEINRGTGAYVAFVPTALTGCDTGCSYRIKESTTDNVVVNHTAKNYKNTTGAMDAFVGPTTEKTIYYRLEIFNDHSGGSSDYCDFHVVYSEGGADDHAITLSTTFQSYTSGSYTLSTGTIGNGNGPNVLHCKAASTSVDRTIGTVNNNCTIVIPAHNDKSNGRGCTLSSNSTYTFVVGTDVPSDLTCGLDN
jgi:hypothetical protein